MITCVATVPVVLVVTAVVMPLTAPDEHPAAATAITMAAAARPANHTSNPWAASPPGFLRFTPYRCANPAPRLPVTNAAFHAAL